MRKWLLILFLLIPILCFGGIQKYHMMIIGQYNAASGCIMGLDDISGLVAQNMTANTSRIDVSVDSGSCSGTAQTFHVYINQVNTTNRRFYVLIYDNSDTQLLEQLVDTITRSTSGWESIDISGAAVSISSSTNYQIGIHAEYQYTQISRNFFGSSNEYDTGASFGDIPAPWSPDGTFTGTEIAMYLTVQ